MRGRWNRKIAGDKTFISLFLYYFVLLVEYFYFVGDLLLNYDTFFISADIAEGFLHKLVKPKWSFCFLSVNMLGHAHILFVDGYVVTGVDVKRNQDPQFVGEFHVRGYL